MKPLGSGEEDLAGLLQRTGLPRSSARCMVALLRGSALRSDELARVADVTSQEVSTAMRDLAARGVASSEKETRAGPGRPGLRHRLSASAAEALEALAARRRAELMEELRLLDQLRGRA